MDRHDRSLTRRELLADGAAIAGALAAAGALRPAAAFAAPAGEGAAPPFQFKELCQIGFVVKDIERSAKEYAAIIGAAAPKIIVTDPVEKALTRFRGESSPARARLAFFKFGTLDLELIEPIGGPSTWREFAEKRGEGVHHIAFRVESMDRALSHLKEKGFVAIQTGDFGSGRYAYVDTTPGLKTLVELLEIYRK